jgi:VacB/RNase II family 3'-5' exoribonuclease
MTAPLVDLRARAFQAMSDAGFHPAFPADALAEVARVQAQPLPAAQGTRDLRDLLWSSLDTDQTRDLDQVEYVEALNGGGIRLLVGIADVDVLVTHGSALDRQAALEATSVYTGVVTFPMLPPELSTDATSLVQAQERLALVAELHLLDSGETQSHDVYPALIRNQAKLTYSAVGLWLEGTAPVPQGVAAVAGLEAQLRLQQQAAERLHAFRQQHGALTFSSIEPVPVLENGQIKGLSVRQHNPAEDIIESFMVAANVAMAQHLRQNHAWSLRRVVKTPKRWNRIQAIAAGFGVKLPDVPDPRALGDFLQSRHTADPTHFPDLSLAVVKLLGAGEYIVETPGAEKEGHFGLAVSDYTHSTAPNRRYADLVTQRLLKASIGGTTGPYQQLELETVAQHCTEREDAARKVERLMRKVVAASLLSSRVGQEFNGIVTGASPKGTYVRLLDFPAEGRLVQGGTGVDVGDKVRVRLASVDVQKGFIDFAR